MKWRRKNQEAAMPDPPKRVSEATAARIRAERNLEERKADAGRVRLMLREWAIVHEQNHIAENLAATMRGGRS